MLRQLELSLETWCLSANYLDRFMAVQLLDKDCLQVRGCPKEDVRFSYLKRNTELLSDDNKERKSENLYLQDYS